MTADYKSVKVTFDGNSIKMTADYKSVKETFDGKIVKWLLNLDYKTFRRLLMVKFWSDFWWWKY